MNYIQRIFLLLLLFGCLTTSESSVYESTHDAQKNVSELKQPIQLITNIINQEYCNREGKVLWLKLSMQYKNRGKQRRILYGNSILPIRILISRNVREAKRKRYQIDQQIEYKFSNGPELIEGAGPDESFVILQPGSSHTAETEVYIPLPDNDMGSDEGLLRAGNHALQLKVATWYWSEEQATKLRERWQKYGDIWSDDVISEPIIFTVKKQHKITNCPASPSKPDSKTLVH